MPVLDAIYDFTQISERIRFYLDTRWRRDVKTMATQTSIGASRLRELVRGKDVPIVHELKQIGRHQFVNKVWLESGFGRPEVRASEGSPVLVVQKIEKEPEMTVAASMCGKGTGKTSLPTVAPVMAGTVGRINDVCHDMWNDNTRRMAETCKIDQELIEKVLAGKGTTAETEAVVTAVAEWANDATAITWFLEGKGSRPKTLMPAPTDFEQLTQKYAPNTKQLLSLAMQAAQRETDTAVCVHQLTEQIRELAGRTDELFGLLDGLRSNVDQKLAGMTSSWLARLTQQDELLANLGSAQDNLASRVQVVMAEVSSRVNRQLESLQGEWENRPTETVTSDLVLTEEGIRDMVRSMLGEARITLSLGDELISIRPQLLPMVSVPTAPAVRCPESELSPEVWMSITDWWTYPGPHTQERERGSLIGKSIAQILRHTRDIVPVRYPDRPGAGFGLGHALYQVKHIRLAFRWATGRGNRPSTAAEFRKFLQDPEAYLTYRVPAPAASRMIESQFSGTALMPIAGWIRYLPDDEAARFEFGVRAPMGKQIRVARKRLRLPETPPGSHYVSDMRCYRDFLFQLPAGAASSVDDFITFWEQHHPDFTTAAAG